MRKVGVILLAFILLIGVSGMVAAETEISGSLKTDFIWDNETEELLDEESLNIILERSFGFDADVYTDLQVDAYRTDKIVVPADEGGFEVRNLSQTDRETEVNISEAYVNYYTENTDWRLGKQELNWGSAYKLQPTNYFNPYDLTDLKALDEKVGVKAVKSTYYAEDNVEVTGVITPFFNSHKMREVEELKQMNEMTTPINNNIKQGLKQAFIQLPDQDYKDYYGELRNNQIIEKVDDQAENMQAGVKVTKRRWGNYDLSISAYHGRDKIPAVDEKEVKKLVENYMNQGYPDDKFNEYYSDKELDLIRYPAANRLGFDVIGDLEEIGVWTELTYSFYEDDNFQDRLEVAVGADRNFDNDLYLVGQFYTREGRTESEKDIRLANIYFDKPVFSFHEVEMTALYETETETYQINPQFNYSLADSTVLEIGATYSDSEESESGLISSITKEQVYARVKVDF